MLAVIVFLALLSITPETSVPEGYTSKQSTEIVPGVTHSRLVSATQTVNVVALAPETSAHLRAVLSNGLVSERDLGSRLERTSSACQRVRCLAAVNADFAELDTWQPVGSLVRDGELARSPNAFHHDLLITPDGSLLAGQLDWSATLVDTALGRWEIDALNRAREADALVLYTPAFGPSTQTNDFGNELILRVVEPSPPVRIGHTALVEMKELRVAGGDSPIPPDGLVLSGHGKSAERLQSLWRRREAGEISSSALLRIETMPEVSQAVGGSPVLLHEGRVWFGADAGDGFAFGRHPRTLVGWNPAGEIFLVTVDGRQPGSAGMDLTDAADLMLRLGATEAINLDGGGSTTMVVNGTVVNAPSDSLVVHDAELRLAQSTGPEDVLVSHVERPVVSVLAVVTDIAPLGPEAIHPGSLSLPSPSVPPLDEPTTVSGTRPVLLSRPLPTPLRRVPVGLGATAAIVVAATSFAHGTRFGGRRPPPGPRGSRNGARVPSPRWSSFRLIERARSRAGSL